MHTLDEYDKKLLRLVQNNNLVSAKELAELVNLSASAEQRRLAKQRAKKIIEADVSIISPSVAELGVTSIVDVVLHDGDSKSLEKFKTALRQRPEVMQCYFVTGTYDFVLVINTKDMQHYERFSKKWLMDNPNVKHFYTHVVMDKVKVGYSVEIL